MPCHTWQLQTRLAVEAGLAAHAAADDAVVGIPGGAPAAAAGIHRRKDIVPPACNRRAERDYKAARTKRMEVACVARNAQRRCRRRRAP